MTETSFYEAIATEGPYEEDGQKIFKYKAGVFVAGEFNGGNIPSVINVLPKPGKYKHSIYGTVVVTKEKNQQFADNFNNEVYQKLIPIDFEHDLVLSGACAYYEPGTAVVLDDGSVDIGVRWEDRGRQAITEGRFYYFSPALLEKWVEPLSKTVYSNVLIGGALTTSPYFKDAHLRPLYASELKTMGELSVGDVHVDTPMQKKCSSCENQFGEESFSADDPTMCSECFAAKPPVDKDPKGESKAEDKNEPFEASSRKENKKLTEETPEVVDVQVFNEMQRKFADMEKNLREANERIAREEVNRRARTFSEIIRGTDPASDGAKIFRGEADVHAKVLDAIYMLEGEDIHAETSLFNAYVTMQRGIAEQFEASDLLTRTIGGRGGDTPSAVGDPERAFAEKVASYQSTHPGIDSNAAYREVAKAEPKLFKAMRKASYVTKSEED